MRKKALMILSIIISIFLACDESKEESYEINYKTCIGRQGTCPGGIKHTHQINKETGTASCRIVKEGNFYLLTFNARDLTANNKGSLLVENLEFDYSPGMNAVGHSCTRGGVQFEEGENEFKTVSCVAGNPAQGQCKVTINIKHDEKLGDIVEGTIECNEIHIDGSGDQYLSTVQESNWHNTFTFINSCVIPDDML